MSLLGRIVWSLIFRNGIRISVRCGEEEKVRGGGGQGKGQGVHQNNPLRFAGRPIQVAYQVGKYISFVFYLPRPWLSCIYKIQMKWDVIIQFFACHISDMRMFYFKSAYRYNFFSSLKKYIFPTRFSKENVRRIAKHFEGQLGRVNDRGSPPTTRHGSPYKYNWLIPIAISIMVGRKKTHEKPTPFFWVCQRNQRRILCLHT